jgi:hypothetical protein
LLVSGPDVFVANVFGSVTEVLASTGALVRVVSGPHANSSLTEVNASTGALVKVLSAPQYHFDGPNALAVSGPDLFVASNGTATVTTSSSVTELNAATGSVVRVLSGPRFQFSYADVLASLGQTCSWATVPG